MVALNPACILAAWYAKPISEMWEGSVLLNLLKLLITHAMLKTASGVQCQTIVECATQTTSCYQELAENASMTTPQCHTAPWDMDNMIVRAA